MLLSSAGCRSEGPDAYGNFEAVEVTVSAETAGPLLAFSVTEGERIAEGAIVGQIDTVQAALDLSALRSQLEAGQSGVGRSTAQSAAIAAELRTAERELERTRRLFDEEAATRQQLDQAEGRAAALRAQLRAANEQTRGVGSEAEVTNARMAVLADQIQRSRIRNPVAGTVLATYAEAGEFVQRGQPLYKIANLDTLVLRAYLSGAQIPEITLGQTVQVVTDAADGELAKHNGTVSWISSAAEFTPTPIQTRDERVDLVYAVKILVPNADGALKIGMPAEVSLNAASQPSTEAVTGQ